MQVISGKNFDFMYAHQPINKQNAWRQMTADLN